MNQNKHKILFTAGGSPVHEALYKQIGCKYDIFVADMNINRISCNIPDEQKIQIRNAGDAEFVSSLSEICKEKNIGLIVPGVDEELIPILINRESFGSTDIFLPKIEFVRTMLDKYSMNQALKEKNINVPKSVCANEDFSGLRFPVIVKPRSGRGSRDIYKLKSPKKLRYFIRSLEGDLNDWIIQECILGKEYTVQVISGIGLEAQAIIPIQVSEKRGSTVEAITCDDSEVKEYCRKIHLAFKPEGTYNIQLMKSYEGNIYAFEINPRISTTFCLAIEIGCDPFLNFFDKDNVLPALTEVPTLTLFRHWQNFISKG